MDNVIVVQAQIDVGAMHKMIKEAVSLDDNDALFGQLAEVQKVKEDLRAAQDAFDVVEAEVKATINGKAQELYGNDWQTIKGTGYKISRSKTGAKYEILDIDAVAPELLVIKATVNSDAVENVVKATNELPKGIAVNPSRGDSIRISVKGVQHG